MIRQADDGWFIERNGRYYHINQQWLDEMHRHQVKPGRKSEQAWNRLFYTFRTSSNPDDVYAAWERFYDSTGNYEPPEPAEPSEFQQFIKEQRANRRQTR